MNFPVPIKNPYFINFQTLSNGDLLATYCEGEYDPLNKKQFILPSEKLYELFDVI